MAFDWLFKVRERLCSASGSDKVYSYCFEGVVLLAILLLVSRPLPSQAKTLLEAQSPVGTASSTIPAVTTVITIGVAGP
jgi:hypothetical protein